MLIRWSLSSKNDILAIANYILQDNKRAAQETLQTIYTSVSRLKDFPFSGRLRHGTEIREIVLTKYPYIISYIIENNNIIILRILHSKRLPET